MGGDGGASGAILPDRFWDKVEITPDHWWFNAYSPSGHYVMFKMDGRQHRAARLMFQFVNGEITGYLRNDCGLRNCVNPDHYTQIYKKARAIEKVVGSEQVAAASRAAKHLLRVMPGLLRVMSVEDIEAQANLMLVELCNAATLDEWENPKTMFWRVYVALRRWVDRMTIDNKRWSLSRAGSLDAMREERGFTLADNRFPLPEPAAIRSCFKDDLEWAVATLPPLERAAFYAGSDRGGESTEAVGARLGVSGSWIKKKRRTADATVVGLLASRGWHALPSEVVA